MKTTVETNLKAKESKHSSTSENYEQLKKLGEEAQDTLSTIKKRLEKKFNNQ